MGSAPENSTYHNCSIWGRPHPQEIATFEELQNDNSGTGYYWDHEVGIVFRKFQVDLVWDPESRDACPLAESSAWCPQFFIRPHPYTGDTDCTARAYPKYSTAMIKSGDVIIYQHYSDSLTIFLELYSFHL